MAAYLILMAANSCFINKTFDNSNNGYKGSC